MWSRFGRAHDRFRIDGVLFEQARYEKELLAPSSPASSPGAHGHLREASPQDGSFVYKREEGRSTCASLPIHHQRRERRAATPRAHGRHQEPRDLGYSGEHLRLFRKMLEAPHGMILVRGPPGAANHDALRRAQAGGVAREEHRDHRRPRGVQHRAGSPGAVNVKAGLTFAVGLRSILRQDPDIILVGRSVISRPRPRRCRQPSPAISCSRRCTPTAPWAP